MTDKRHLRTLSRSAGAALLTASCVLPLALMPIFRLAAPAFSSEALWDALVSIFAGAFVLLPATLLGRALLPAEERKQALPCGKSQGKPAAVLFAGVAVCYWANLASTLIAALGRRAGAQFHGPEVAQPTGIGMLLLTLVAMAVVPAITEELLLRGVVMQPLRKHGDGCAVVCSALLFGLMHGNLQQAPMAFVSGLALGWAALRCGSLRVPVAIHFWNNAAVVLFMFLRGRLSGAVFSQVQLGYMIALTALGLLGLLAICWRRERRAKLMPRGGGGRRALRYFFGSVPMVLAIAWFLWRTWQMTTLG